MSRWAEKTENINTKEKHGQKDKLIEDRKVYIQFIEKMYNRAKSVEDVVKQLPKEGQQIRIITQKSFNAFAILLYIVQNKPVEQVDLAIYRIDQNSVEGLARIVQDNQIKKLNIVLSFFFRASKRAETWHELLIAHAKKRQTNYAILLLESR